MKAAAVVELDDLSSQRDYVRLRALHSIVNYLSADYRIQFAEKNFATLLYACLKCIKGGFFEQIVLATRALSLLSMTIGPGNQAAELYNEAHPLIDQILSSRDEPSLISAINLLAVSTFVYPNSKKKEAAMTGIWKIIRSTKSVQVLFAAFAAWSFILSSTNFCRRLRAGLFADLEILLYEGDESVQTAAEDAINLLQDNIVRGFLTIDKYNLEYRSSRTSVQVQFVKDFLGRGFEPHMLENEFLQDVFNFTPEEQTSKEEDRVYTFEREEVVVRVCMPMHKVIHAPSKMATVSKGRTLLLKKKRLIKNEISSERVITSFAC